MKKTAFAVFILFIFCFCGAFAFAQTENQEEKLLQETLSLSQKVKEFEKTIGIQPSNIFSVTAKEKPGQSLLCLWVHNFKDVLSSPIMVVSIKFESGAEKIPPIKNFGVFGQNSQLYSYYFRILNAYADPDLPITVEFAKEKNYRKVMTIIHEDMHLAPILGEEEFVTPLADIAALKFFENIGDDENAQKMKEEIIYFRQVSQEINIIIKKVQEIFKRDLPFSEERKEIQKIICLYPSYAKMFDSKSRDQGTEIFFEALINHDFRYFGYYERVIGLYEKIGDLKILISLFGKNAFSGENGKKYFIECHDKNSDSTYYRPDYDKYLDDLEKKYGLSGQE